MAVFKKIKMEIVSAIKSWRFRGMRTSNRIFIFTLFFLFFLFAFGVGKVEAANLYFSPASGSYNVGNTVSVNIYVSSSDQSINAVSGVVYFPADKLEILSLSKSGSISSLWVEEPSFSNVNGTFSFEGVVLNPGFTGSAGKVITANFKVKSAGQGVLGFSSGSVLANDGKGSNVLTDMSKASFSFGGVVPSSPVSEVTENSQIPEISSPTHPDPNSWYPKNRAEFTWPLPSGVTGVRLLANQSARTTPSVVYSPPISEKEITDLEDGISYFHVQFRDASGWGQVVHFKVQVDTEKPASLSVSEIEREDATDPRVVFKMFAKDSLSGIDHFKITLDDEGSIIWKDDGSHEYQTEALPSGKHKLLTKVYDKAGNFLEITTDFLIKPISSPIIEDYQKNLTDSELLSISGTALPKSEVEFWFKGEADFLESQMTDVDKEGKFSFVSKKRLHNGSYKIWAETVDRRGARSAPSEQISVKVSPPAFIQFGSKAISLLSALVPLVALIITLVVILLHGWRKISFLRRKIRRETHEAGLVLHKAFELLKEDIKDQIKLLEKTRGKRELTEEEEKIVKQLKKNIDQTEKLVMKEIDDIEKVDS